MNRSFFVPASPPVMVSLCSAPGSRRATEAQWPRPVASPSKPGAPPNRPSPWPFGCPGARHCAGSRRQAVGTAHIFGLHYAHICKRIAVRVLWEVLAEAPRGSPFAPARRFIARRFPRATRPPLHAGNEGFGFAGELSRVRSAARRAPASNNARTGIAKPGTTTLRSSPVPDFCFSA